MTELGGILSFRSRKKKRHGSGNKHQELRGDKLLHIVAITEDFMEKRFILVVNPNSFLESLGSNQMPDYTIVFLTRYIVTIKTFGILCFRHFTQITQLIIKTNLEMISPILHMKNRGVNKFAGGRTAI